MTAVNWLLRPSAASVITDTVQHGMDGQLFGFTSKVAVLPHLNVIMATRGTNYLASWAYMIARGRVNTGGIDNLANILPQFMNDFQPAHAAEVKATQLATGVELHPELQNMASGQQEILAFGWSDRTGRMVGLVFSSHRAFCPFLLQDGLHFAPEIWIEPTEAERRVLAKRKSPESLIVGTMVQRRDIAANVGGMTIGGELILTEIRRGSLAMRTIHRFKEDFAAYEQRNGN